MYVGIAAYITLIVSMNSSFQDWISVSIAATLINSFVTGMLGYVMGTMIAGWASHEKRRREEIADIKQQLEELTGANPDKFKLT